jgi:hypothetical protein
VDATTGIHVSVAIVGIGIVFTAFETIWLALHGAYGVSGVWPWKIVRECYPPLIAIPLSPFASAGPLVAVLLARIASVALVFYDYAIGTTAALPLGFLVVTHFLVSLRNRWGGEGGDQMTAIVLMSGLSADAFSREAGVATCATLFVGAQITLSYLASGAAKLAGPLWREGTALQRIMSNYAYGHQGLSRLLARYPLVCKVICYSVIAFQLSFFLFFFLPAPIAYAYLVGGGIFHSGIAFFMRLNLFCFAFMGTYPCLIFARQFLRALLDL